MHSVVVAVGAVSQFPSVRQETLEKALPDRPRRLASMFLFSAQPQWPLEE